MVGKVTKQSKRRINQEANKYLQLLDVEKTHFNPLHHSFLYLNSDYFYPSSKHIDEVKYSNMDVGFLPEEDHMVFKENKTIYQDFSLLDNLEFTHGLSQMMAKTIKDTRVLHVYNDDDQFQPIFQLRIPAKETKIVRNKYDSFPTEM